MSAQSIRAPGAQRLAVASAAAALAVLTLAALRYGPVALGLPLAAVAALALLQRARLTVALVVGLMVLVEGSTDDFLGYRGLYDPIRFGVTPMEYLLAWRSLRWCSTACAPGARCGWPARSRSR